MKKYLLLGFIILAATVLRFYQLGVNPPSLTWDEVAFGYNAYSLGVDGRDEFGQYLPIVYLESFGDFKPPVYAYLDVVPVKIFGLTPFAVRFPSALFGVLTVLLTYFLTKRIFYSSEHKELYALTSSFVLALSPWHIMLSRAGFEANVATFFVVAGIFTFLAGMQEKKWWIVVSAVSFVLAMNTFNSSRVVVPLVILALGAVFFKKLWKQRKQTFTAILVGLVLLAPLIPFLFSPQAGLRFKEVNIFSDSTLVTTSNQEIANDGNAIWSKAIHNRRVQYSLAFLQHYFDHFNPGYLFIRGDVNTKFSIQDVGELYLWDLPFFIIGGLFLFRRKEGYWWIIPVWLLLGIIPAATARETPHALRTEVILPTMQIIVGYGIAVALLFVKEKIKRHAVKHLLLGIGGCLLIANIFYFQYEYYKHYPRLYSQDWQYGYQQAIDFVSKQPGYEKVYDSGSYGRPYIYYLFFTKTDPGEFRKTLTVQRDAFGFVHVKGFGKYVFPEDFGKLPKSEKALYVDSVNNVPKHAKIIKTIGLVDGTPSLAVYTY